MAINDGQKQLFEDYIAIGFEDQGFLPEQAFIKVGIDRRSVRIISIKLVQDES
jgi:hypothetical protein